MFTRKIVYFVHGTLCIVTARSGALPLGELESTHSVSYTHLDVYKRQLLLLLLFILFLFLYFRDCPFDSLYWLLSYPALFPSLLILSL